MITKRHNLRNAAVAMSSVVFLGIASPTVWSADNYQSGAARDKNKTDKNQTYWQEKDRQERNKSTSTQAAAGQTQSLEKKTVDEINGMEVINADDGKVIGKVAELVTDKDKRQLHAVIAVDQLMDLIGGKKVVVPIGDLNLKDEKLQISATEKDLKNRPEYQEGEFYGVSETERPLSDFAEIKTSK